MARNRLFRGLPVGQTPPPKSTLPVLKRPLGVCPGTRSELELFGEMESYGLRWRHVLFGHGNGFTDESEVSRMAAGGRVVVAAVAAGLVAGRSAGLFSAGCLWSGGSVADRR